MKKSVEAMYEHGVFCPLEPVDLPEHQRVQVTVADEDKWLDRDDIQWAASQVQETVSWVPCARLSQHPRLTHR
jgi:predicted DNA-binding antitoxin AbrB/MazE fold protein